MTEATLGTPPEPVDEIRGLIHNIHQNGYSNVSDMQRFIILYQSYKPARGGYEEFCQSLDSPEIGFEFWEGVFDDVVAAYDALGGSRFALAFPETGRLPSDSWQAELTDLVSTFNDETTKYPESHALYVRMHAKQLEEASENDTQFQSLLANPCFLDALVRVYDFEEYERDDDLGYSATSHIPEFWPHNDGFLEKVLSAVGYKYAESYYTDWRHVIEGSVIHDSVSNLKAIAQLEEARAGATQYLSEQFGIRHFSRYPVELLVKQFDCQAQASRPYGIMIGAVDDHNGAFSGGELLAGKLHVQVDKTHDVFVAEAETANEFELRLKHFDAVNNKQYQIDFAVIETHGSSDSIRFGISAHMGSLALKAKLSETRNILSARASVLMTGCSTGQINGIAQSLSRQLNAIVVAPPIIVSTENITFIGSPESIRLVPQYKNSNTELLVKPVIYKKGSPLGEQKTAAYLDLTKV